MAVNKWRRRIPAERVLDIYHATNGEITPHEMRPDIYPDPDWRP
jgi:DNA-binding transcriptional regulator YdaS (Cro superfamily)|tara:strand:- start:130 stop:261 length:132 start_codon:yes stop_codon:yes gene_type:complete